MSPLSSRTREPGWRRGELAARAGCHPETVRFYERIGLLPPVPRTDRGHRRYGPAHLARLRFVRAARRLGFSLEEVRELLAVGGRGGTCEEVRALAARHLLAVEHRLAELTAVRDRLAALVAGCRRGEDPDCALLERLFAGPWDG